MVITDARLGGMSGYDFLNQDAQPLARPAGADDHRLRHAQTGGRSHQGRRDGLSGQAVRAGGTAPRRRALRRAPPAVVGERPAARPRQ